jgi:hypothetical protein
MLHMLAISRSENDIYLCKVVVVVVGDGLVAVRVHVAFIQLSKVFNVNPREYRKVLG